MKKSSPTRGPSADATPRSALLFGASGLVGARLLALLLESGHYARVHALVRRPLAAVHPRLRVHVVDFDGIGGLPDFPAVDDVYCCLGTTIRAAGSRPAFRRVDHDYVVATARAAREHGARRLAVVSALGADGRSPVFYNRTKGEMEAAVSALGYDSVTILRPSLLAGERAERRAGERLALALSRPLAPLIPRRYRPIDAGAVARAMVHFVLDAAPGVHRVESDRLQDFVAA